MGVSRLCLVVLLGVMGCGGDDDGPSPGTDAGGGMDAGEGDVDAGPGDGDAGEDEDAGPPGCADDDGDGRMAASCGGDDCDDADPNRFPGNPEICDVAGHDEDCDPGTFGFRDADMDGVPDAACCNDDGAGGSACGRDCDDMAPTTNPGAPETCDLVDNDCDGSTDEGVLETFWVDADGDDFGDADPMAMTMLACSRPMGYADNRDDCDDMVGAVNPGAREICDMVDNDCDRLIDPGCSCITGTMQPCGTDVGACSRGMQTCVSGMWSACAGGVAPVGPPEVACDGVDEDCDGLVDESVMTACFADPDRDGFAAAATMPVMRCGCNMNETATVPTGRDVDCDPMNRDVNPAASEMCNRRDDDCSSGGGAEPLEDVDMDMHTDAAYRGCSGGYPVDDCHDGDGRVFPGQSLFFIMPANSPPMDFWDYNCDGRSERQPPDSGMCTMGGTCAPTCAGVSCTGFGIFYDASMRGGPQCGDPVGYSCRCSILPSCGCVRVSNGRALPCR